MLVVEKNFLDDLTPGRGLKAFEHGSIVSMDQMLSRQSKSRWDFDGAMG